jgi:hypothetical protein
MADAPTAHIRIRLTAQQLEQLKKRAEACERSIAQEVRVAITKHLKRPA